MSISAENLEIKNIKIFTVYRIKNAQLGLSY